jgi:hypothetical protein
MKSPLAERLIYAAVILFALAALGLMACAPFFSFDARLVYQAF